MATTPESRALGDRVGVAAPTFRLVAAVLLAAAAPLASDAGRDAQVRFATLVAFGWIPAAGVLALVTRRVRHQALDVVAVVLDLVLLVMLGVVLDPGGEMYVIVLLLLAAYHTYVGGRFYGFLAGALGLLLIAWMSHRGAHHFDAIAVAAYPIVVVALVWLLDAAASERSQARDRVVRLHEKSDAILSGVAEAVVVTAPDGRIEQWNRAAEHTFVCPQARAFGRGCEDVLALRLDVRELDCRAGCALLDVHASSGTPTGTDVEVWRTDAMGDRQPLLATVLPVVDRDGTTVEIVHSFRDITKLRQADEAKTLFLATTSHELKTPLTVIRGFTQMLLDAEDHISGDEKQVALRAIDTRARQLAGIVDRLLLSSRIESGHIDLVLESADIGPILEEQVSAVRGATARDVVLDFDGEVLPVRVDVSAFTTVVEHLLDNAVKYSPAGGAITVTARTYDDHVEIDVADEGVGMTHDQAAHCFDRFWQADASDVRRFGGTGIGLYIVRSLVEGMNGRVSVASEPNRGSVFTVSLQRADRATAERREVEATPGRGESSIIREYMRQLGVRMEASE